MSCFGSVTTRSTFLVPFLPSYSISDFNCISSHPSTPSAPCPPVSWPSMWRAPSTTAWRWGPSWQRTTKCASSPSAWSTAAPPATAVQPSTAPPVWPVWATATTPPPLPPPTEHTAQPDLTGPPPVSVLSTGPTSSTNQTAAVTWSRGRYCTRCRCRHQSELSGNSWRERRWARGNRSFRSWRMSFTSWWTPGRWPRTWRCPSPRYVKLRNWNTSICHIKW